MARRRPCVPVIDHQLDSGIVGQSLHLAPWWAEARYNSALAREASGDFNGAIAELKIYLVFSLADTERREAQDKIYALEAKTQLAAEKKTEEDSKVVTIEVAPLKSTAAVGTKLQFKAVVKDASGQPLPDPIKHWYAAPFDSAVAGDCVIVAQAADN